MPSTTKQSTQSASTAPAAPVLKQRQRTPSVMTPLFAAIAQDVTAPQPQVSATPTVSSASTASATAPPQAPSIATGAVPVVTTATTATSTATAAPVAAPAAPNLVNPPPDADIPVRPAGFTPPDPHEFMGYHPTAKEAGAATSVIRDLATNDDYVATFGSAVPSPATLSTALQLGVEWLAMHEATESWDVYARAQNNLAWKGALMLLDQLKPTFLNALAANPALALKYPGLTQMFDAAKLVAKKSVATRTRNAKAKAAAATAATAAASAAQAAPAAPAAVPTVSTAAAPAAAARTVTVTG